MPRAKRGRLFLIDGMSSIYRAFYAIRNLSNSRGLPTNAIFGFTNTIRKLLTSEKPDYMAVVFESEKKTFRHEAYEAYKATRQPMPDDLVTQLPYIQRVCEVYGLPIIRVEGYEADDVIGALATRAAEAGLDVVIVTNDKDMSQLVNDRVQLLRFERTGDTRMMDARAVEEKLGVRPDQVVDLLGLWGDTIDNIPGAPGVGEKGAKQIIQQFGSIETALARAHEISRKTYRESLQKNADLIRQSRELVTIHTGLPIELDLESLRTEEPDREAAHALFSELEFAQLTREFADARRAAESVGRKRHYLRVTTRKELEALLSELWDCDRVAIAIDESDGALSGIAFSSGPGIASLVDLKNFEPDGDAFRQIRELLENGLVRKSLHDWKRALTLLDAHASRGAPRSRKGCPPEFEPAVKIEGVQGDTMLAAYLLDPNRTTFKVMDVAREHLRLEPGEPAQGFSDEEWRALETADLTFQLDAVLPERIEEAGLQRVYSEIEMPLVEILFEMERIGMFVDVAALDSAGKEMERELERLTSKIHELAGQEFNINSTVQLGEIFEKLQFDVGRKTRTGRISTSADVLEELAARYELPRLIIEYREIAKLKNTYVDALPKLIDSSTGRVHTTLNQAVAATGRLSSANPNLQNIPIRSEMGRRIRAAFVAPKGCVLISADYSQIELRLFAHITGDEAMTEAFRRGEDIHAKTAREVFGASTPDEEWKLRRVAKIVNFAIPYVIGPFGLAQRTSLSRAEAKKVIEDYYNTYRGVRRYMEETPARVRETGVVRTLFGRIRPIPDINNRNHNLRARAEREAINAPLQGTVADLVKMAMIKVHQRLRQEGLRGRMLLQVHDELLLEVPESEVERTRRIVRSEMESIHELSVPLVVDIAVGENWRDVKD